MIRRTERSKKLLEALCGAVSGLAVIACIALAPFAVGPAIADETHACTPTEAGVFTKAHDGNRIHVRCSSAPAAAPTVFWFAYRTSDSANADRFLSLINFAIQNGKTLTIWYDPISKSGPSIGCQAADCRLIDAMAAH
ncbi:MAG TPA: hypothetical protein VGJ94_06850 [Syntrophorhabdaceae bacterium]|jgi:hypothetical protein